MHLKGRIYKNMWLVVVIGAITSTLLILFAFYNIFSSQIETDTKNKARLLSESLNFTPINSDYLSSVGKQGDYRITYMHSDGVVVFDNFANAKDMDNHQNRTEVQLAIKNGFGEDTRKSSTLVKETYYYAIRLEDGSVIRVSQTTDNILSMFLKIFPAVCVVAILILIVCNFLSIRLARNIIEPINAIDLNSEDGIVYDEFAPFIRKITEQRKQIFAQLETLEIRALTTNAIMQNMQEGLILLDKQGVILSANTSALSVFKENENFSGRNILELTRNVQILESVKKALCGQHCDFVCVLLGHSYHIFINYVENGGAIVLLLDITHKAMAEKNRREFSANVSHELKTPLTTISGYAEMINTGMVEKDDITGFAGKIKEEANRLIALIEDIIRLSMLDENMVEMQSESFDLMELVNAVVERLEPIASERGIELLVEGEKRELDANRRMIGELITNLADNAIKYNVDGGQVKIEISGVENHVRITVSDTGIGIAEEHLERIFERFYRVDKSRSKRTGGTGLGLSIARHIAEYHGGKISATSEEGKGTAIEVLI